MGSEMCIRDRVHIAGSKPFRISTTPTTRGSKRRFLGSIPPCKVWKPQPNWLVANWLRLMDPARCESCPSGQRRGPTAPGEERVLSPDHQSFYISKTKSNDLGTTTGIPRVDTAPHGVITPPHWVVADWLGLMEPAGGGGCPSGQGRGYAAHGEVKVPSPDPATRGRKRRSPESIQPRRVWKPQPHWLVTDWLGLMGPARGESCPSGQRRGPAAVSYTHLRAHEDS